MLTIWQDVTVPNSADGNSTTPTYPIGSVDSALRLLLLIAKRDHLRIADASRELGVARSTAHRLMQMLQYHGLVRQDPESKSYSAGQALINLGLQVVGKLDIRAAARDAMEVLAAELQETVHLIALQPDAKVICLQSVESPKALRVGDRTGMILEAHATSAGRAMLSTLTDEEVKALYPNPRLTKVQPGTIATRKELLDELRLIRERGYAVQSNQSEPDVSAISVPIQDGEASASLALTVAIPTSRFPSAELPAIGDLLTRHAAQIAGALVP